MKLNIEQLKYLQQLKRLYIIIEFTDTYSYKILLRVLTNMTYNTMDASRINNQMKKIWIQHNHRLK